MPNYHFMYRDCRMLAEWLTHKEQLKNYIVKQTSDPDLADDILQEAYIKASQRQISQKREAKLKVGYIASRDHDYRTQQIYEELIDNQVEEEMPIELGNLQTIGHCLRPMFECLPEKYRQAMTLSQLDGLPQQTVEDQLRLSLSAMKS